jgi:hypothetical protein
VAGGLWLLALSALAYFQFHVGLPPNVEGVPVPTLMLIVGLLGGLVLAFFGRLMAKTSANRAARAARAALRAEVEVVAQQEIVEPVTAELGTVEQFRNALTTARSG